MTHLTEVSSLAANTGNPGDLPRIRRDISGDQIAILTFDHPDKSANIFDSTTMREFNVQLSEIETLDVRGLVIRSAKPKIFIAGADIGALGSLPKAALNTFIHEGQTVFQRLADLKIPTVAAIHGACMGGGLELALACDWRLASDSRATKLGLPETQLGILPAWGGCTRLPRLIGLPKALGLILTGKRFDGKKGHKLGVVDAVVPREQLVEHARVFVDAGKRPAAAHVKTNNPVSAGAAKIFAGLKVRKQTRGHYPAAMEALKVATAAVSTSVEKSLENEREAVLKLAETEACKNLIRVFNLQQRARRLGAKGKKVERAAVIGAGVMGAGIAHWVSSRGMPVVMQDIDEAKVAAGMSSIRKLYTKSVRRRIFNLREATRRMDLVHGTASRVPLTREDLIIEAAVENLELKKKIFADLCKRTRSNAVLATNTSALPIGELAESPEITNPDRILGIHFFNPVHRMKLVEIVVAKQTSQAAVDTALSFVRSIGKTPVVVKDSPGFLVNRILMPYLIAAGELYDRGVDARLIDEAMLDFGMPMGPIRLLDEIGLDVALHVAKTMSDAFEGRMEIPPILSRMVDSGQFGRKSGTGFYRYAKNGKQHLSQAALEIRSFESPLKISVDEITDLLSILMVDEAQRCLDERIVDNADDIDFAMILGTGWAPFRGGPMKYAETEGRQQLRGRFRAANDVAKIAA